MKDRKRRVNYRSPCQASSSILTQYVKLMIIYLSEDLHFDEHFSVDLGVAWQRSTCRPGVGRGRPNRRPQTCSRGLPGVKTCLWKVQANIHTALGRSRFVWHSVN